MQGCGRGGCLKQAGVLEGRLPEAGSMLSALVLSWSRERGCLCQARALGMQHNKEVAHAATCRRAYTSTLLQATCCKLAMGTCHMGLLGSEQPP